MSKTSVFTLFYAVNVRHAHTSINASIAFSDSTVAHVDVVDHHAFTFSGK